MSNDDADRQKAKFCAKLFVPETAEFATREAVQIFGGYGYMKDYEVGKRYVTYFSMC